MQYTVNIQAGKWARQATQGTYLVLLETGAATSIKARIMLGSQVLEEIRTARRGYKARTSQDFTHVEFSATVDTTAEVIISSGQVDVDAIDGASVNATIVNAPLAVQNDRGTPGAPVYVSGLLSSDSPATGMSEGAGVAVNSALTAITGASAARKSVRFFNQGPDAVAIGGGALTWAGRGVVLEAGDTWEENRGANLAWYARCDAGKTATVGVQGITA
jgi:hypothetical protein